VTYKDKAYHHLQEVERWDARVNALDAWAEKEVGTNHVTRELFLLRMEQQLGTIQKEYAGAVSSRNRHIQMTIMYGIMTMIG
jgi:hypothetical protein